MPADSSLAGHLAALWRYPVKSMMGEELNASKDRKTPCVGVFARVLRGGIVRRGDTCRIE